MPSGTVTIGENTRSLGGTSLTGKGAGVRIDTSKPVNIGANSRKIGNTTVTGNGAKVKAGGAVENFVLDTPTESAKTLKSYSPSGSNPMTAGDSSQSQIGVRNWMTDNGFDNYKIGYDNINGTVTYNGQPFLVPSNVQDGVSTAPESALTRAAQDYYANQGLSGVRNSLTGRGIANDRIGYNASTGTITIDGRDTGIKPETNLNGTTYGSEGIINELTNQAYDSADDPLVSSRDYADSLGYGGLVSWDGNNVSVGGQSFAPTYVTSDGRAYVSKAQLDNAIASFRESNDIIGNGGVVDRYSERYDQPVQGALDKILGREAFDYDPNEDIAYQAYRDMYTRMADDALERVLNENNTSITGASGAVLSEALAARDNYLTQLTDKIPELVGDAYNRYTGETDRLNRNLDQLRTVGNDYYSKLYQQNRDAYSDTMQGIQYGDQEDQRWFDNYRQLVNDEYSRRLTEQEIISAILSNDDTRLNQALSHAYARGSFTPEEAALWGVPTSQLPWNGQLSYTIDSAIANAYGSALGSGLAQNATNRLLASQAGSLLPAAVPASANAAASVGAASAAPAASGTSSPASSMNFAGASPGLQQILNSYFPTVDNNAAAAATAAQLAARELRGGLG